MIRDLYKHVLFPLLCNMVHMQRITDSFFNSSQIAGPKSKIASTRAVIATHGDLWSAYWLRRGGWAAYGPDNDNTNKFILCATFCRRGVANAVAILSVPCHTRRLYQNG